MRNLRWLGVISALACAGTVHAQATVGDAIVRVPQAEVRGRNSTIYPVTNVLKNGAQVHVVRAEGDEWLAITPPAGASNWINERFIQFEKRPAPGQPAWAYVLTDDVPVLVGTPDLGVPKTPIEEQAKLSRGAIVRVLGETAMYDNGQWWRIQPPGGAVRFIRRDAIDPPAQVVASNAPATTVSNASPSRPALLIQAEQAEQSGNLARADLLYRQLAAEMSQPGGDQDLAARCYNRSEMLQRQLGTAVACPTPGQTAGMLTSASRTVPPTMPVAVNQAPQPTVMTTGPGWLRRSSFLIDGQTAYVIEDGRGQFRLYALPQAGLNLEQFVNRQVEMFGPLVTRNDLAGGCLMSVGRVHLLR